MAMLSTSAWVLHDLGLAAGFAGPIFGKIALEQAVKDIDSASERGKVLHDVWSRYNLINTASLGVAAGTWLIGRAAISGRSIDKQTHALVLAKDILLCGALVTGFLNIASGRELGRTTPGEAAPVAPGKAPSVTHPRAAGLQRLLGVMGPVNLALTAGVIGVTAVLAMKSGRSTKWSFVSRLLP